MKICVLDKATMGDDLDFSCLEKFGEVTLFDYTTENELFDRASSADIIILNKVRIGSNILSNSPKLKMICVFATGYDNIDLESARANNIAVANVPAYSTESVMLFTVSNVLYLFSKLKQYNDFVKSGEYTASGRPNALIPVYHELKGKVWGIVGFGNIGRRVGEVAQALGARVVVNKRTKVDDFECVDIDTLCEMSDIITLHCPLNSATRGIISRERIEKMKKGVIIVNEARGAVIDEMAIADAILSEKIAAFGSDVYSAEPFGTEHPFYKIMSLDNVCLTPHSAWGAYESRKRCLDIICSNILSFVDKKTQNRVDI